ncbi:MAG TPA: ATP synthase subunit I [Kofleriaceae bacterium]|nr:ATP synthase subunit I [Kofleriaceae bacterium]
MASPSILRIERLNYALGAVVIAVAALTQSMPVALGLAVGVILTCANFFVLRKLIVKWTSDAAAGRSGSAPLLMLPKMIGLMGAVAVAILLLPIDVVAFTVGYSIFLVSIIIDTTHAALRSQPDHGNQPPANKPTEPSEHNHG